MICDKCSSQEPHEHLSLPDPPGTTRLAMIRERLRSLHEPTTLFPLPEQGDNDNGR